MSILSDIENVVADFLADEVGVPVDSIRQTDMGGTVDGEEYEGAPPPPKRPYVVISVDTNGEELVSGKCYERTEGTDQMAVSGTSGRAGVVTLTGYGYGAYDWLMCTAALLDAYAMWFNERNITLQRPQGPERVLGIHGSQRDHIFELNMELLYSVKTTPRVIPESKGVDIEVTMSDTVRDPITFTIEVSE